MVNEATGAEAGVFEAEEVAVVTSICGIPVGAKSVAALGGSGEHGEN